MRIDLQPAYVIHRRPYRDSSVLLDAFTPEYGRVGLVARGVRRASRGSSKAALLQPFRPLLVSFSGRGELKTLVAVEPAQGSLALHGERLLSGMYVNELLVRLLHHNDAHPLLFAAYSAALEELGGVAPLDAILRRFELRLLEDLGYRLELVVDARSRTPVRADQWYRYDPGVGLVASLEVSSGPQTAVFAGRDLLAMGAGDFTGSARGAAKRLLRAALAVHLGDKPLRSRELFPSSGRAGCS
jgi:DNA repair protein RecO (recombination protein O)